MKEDGDKRLQTSEPPSDQVQFQSQAPLLQSKEPTALRAAGLLGLAFVGRGEVALIVAELARPILFKNVDANGDAEPFVVVIWAILLSPVGGALGVGLLLRSWK